MSDKKTESKEQGDIHGSGTFQGGIRALLSVALYSTIGVVLGHYIGRWGEDLDRGAQGMSTMLGRIVGGVGLGGLAAYVSLRNAAEDEQARNDLMKENAVLQERVKILETRPPAAQVDMAIAEHEGTVQPALLEKAV